MTCLEKIIIFRLAFILFFFKSGPIGQQLVYEMSVNCTSFYMQVDFILKSPYLDTETFRFDNSSCGSRTATSEHVSLRTPLDACGTTSRNSDNSVTYVNKVVAETIDKETIYIVEFPFSCTYRNQETIGVPSFQPRKKVTYFKGKIVLRKLRLIFRSQASSARNRMFVLFSGILFNIKWKHGQGCIN